MRAMRTPTAVLVLGLLSFVTGVVNVRKAGRKFDPPALAERWRKALGESGIATRDGYWFAIWLPGPDGRAVLAKGGEVLDPKAVVADLAERGWCAYAWAEKHGETGRRTFFVGADWETWATDGTKSVVPDLKTFPTESPPKDGNEWTRLP